MSNCLLARSLNNETAYARGGLSAAEQENCFLFFRTSLDALYFVARVGESRGEYMVLLGKPEGKNHLEDPDVNGRVILR